MKHFYSYLTPLILANLALSGCSRYAFSVNENELYRPAPLYSDFSLADPSLDACVRQTIQDQRITKVEQLRSLRCRHGGIRSLEGLEHFHSLQKLDLSSNDISDSTALRKLRQLQYLNISDNPQLKCEDLSALGSSDKREVRTPKHCSDD